MWLGCGTDFDSDISKKGIICKVSLKLTKKLLGHILKISVPRGNKNGVLVCTVIDELAKVNSEN